MRSSGDLVPHRVRPGSCRLLRRLTRFDPPIEPFDADKRSTVWCADPLTPFDPHTIFALAFDGLHGVASGQRRDFLRDVAGEWMHENSARFLGLCGHVLLLRPVDSARQRRRADESSCARPGHVAPNHFSASGAAPFARWMSRRSHCNPLASTFAHCDAVRRMERCSRRSSGGAGGRPRGRLSSFTRGIVWISSPKKYPQERHLL